MITRIFALAAGLCLIIAPIRVERHTDAIGSDSYNFDLSLRRSHPVKAWFQAHGFSAPISATGLGEKQPIESNEMADGSDNPVGRQRNRRVEIIMKKSGD